MEEEEIKSMLGSSSTKNTGETDLPSSMDVKLTDLFSYVLLLFFLFFLLKVN